MRGVVLAWLIPQSEFGLFGIALLVVNVLLPICSLGLYEGATRYAPLHESSGTLAHFVGRTLRHATGIALIATLILVILADPMGSVLFAQAQTASGVAGAFGGSHGVASLVRASAVCVWVLTIYHVLCGVFKGLRMFVAVGVADLASAGLFTLLATAAALLRFTSAETLILTYAVASLIVAVPVGLGLRAEVGMTRRAMRDGSHQPRSGLLTYSIWSAGIAVLWNVLSCYPMWYLLKVSDGATVGTFHAVRTVTQLLQVAAAMGTGVLAANVARLWEHKGRGPASANLTLLTKAFTLVLIGGAAMLSLARPLMMRLFPSAFASGVACYDPLLLSFLLVGVVGLLVVRVNLLEKPVLGCLAWLVGVVVNVAACYVLLGPGNFAVATDAAGSQTAALGAAAWAGVAGVTAALAVCLAVARREGLAVDVRTLVLIACAFSLGFGWRVALPVALLLVTAAFATSIILSPAERAELRIILTK